MKTELDIQPTTDLTRIVLSLRRDGLNCHYGTGYALQSENEVRIDIVAPNQLATADMLTLDLAHDTRWTVLIAGEPMGIQDTREEAIALVEATLINR